jgi:hypothetical protein
MGKPFDHNDRAAILAALTDPDPNNVAALAIEERLDALTQVLLDAIGTTGDIPESITFTKPKSVLEEIVIELFEATIQDQYEVIAERLGVEVDELPRLPKVVILDYGRQ